MFRDGQIKYSLLVMEVMDKVGKARGVQYPEPFEGELGNLIALSTHNFVSNTDRLIRGVVRKATLGIVRSSRGEGSVSIRD